MPYLVFLLNKLGCAQFVFYSLSAKQISERVLGLIMESPGFPTV